MNNITFSLFRSITGFHILAYMQADRLAAGNAKATGARHISQEHGCLAELTLILDNVTDKSAALKTPIGTCTINP